MKVVLISSLLTLSACIGAPFTIGETASADGGPPFTDLAPDVTSGNAGQTDPPDVQSTTQNTGVDAGGAIAVPEASVVHEASAVEEEAESEASAIHEASVVAEASTTAPDAEVVHEASVVPEASTATPDAEEVDSGLYPGATRCAVPGGQTLLTYWYAPDSGPGPSPTLEWISASCGVLVCCPLVTDPSMSVPPLVPYCTNLQTDPINCGGCGITCSSGNCISGTCQ